MSTPWEELKRFGAEEGIVAWAHTFGDRWWDAWPACPNPRTLLQLAVAGGATQWNLVQAALACASSLPLAGEADRRALEATRAWAARYPVSELASIATMASPPFAALVSLCVHDPRGNDDQVRAAMRAAIVLGRQLQGDLTPLRTWLTFESLARAERKPPPRDPLSDPALRARVSAAESGGAAALRALNDPSPLVRRMALFKATGTGAAEALAAARSAVDSKDPRDWPAAWLALARLGDERDRGRVAAAAETAHPDQLVALACALRSLSPEVAAGAALRALRRLVDTEDLAGWRVFAGIRELALTLRLALRTAPRLSWPIRPSENAARLRQSARYVIDAFEPRMRERPEPRVIRHGLAGDDVVVEVNEGRGQLYVAVGGSPYLELESGRFAVDEHSVHLWHGSDALDSIGCSCGCSVWLGANSEVPPALSASIPPLSARGLRDHPGMDALLEALEPGRYHLVPLRVELTPGPSQLLGRGSTAGDASELWWVPPGDDRSDGWFVVTCPRPPATAARPAGIVAYATVPSVLEDPSVFALHVLTGAASFHAAVRARLPVELLAIVPESELLALEKVRTRYPELR